MTGAVKNSRIAGGAAQRPLVFPLANTSLNCGADALVCSRPPGRLFVSGKHLIPRANSGSRGTRADLGVCPTCLASQLTGASFTSFDRS